MTIKDLVLLGGGHSHVEVLRAFRHYNRNRNLSHNRNPNSSSSSGSTNEHRLTLINRGRFTPYSGMLPGWASGFYSYDECHIDLQRLASYAGARLVLGEATGVDIQARKVYFGDGDEKGDVDDMSKKATPAPPVAAMAVVVPPPVPYNVLSIDIGITPGKATVPGADEHATAVKPIDGFVRRYEQLLERYRAAAAAAAVAAAAAASRAPPVDVKGAPGDPLFRVCIVGGGAGGVELAAAVWHRLEEERRRGGWAAERASVAVCLLCRGDLLPGHPPHVRRLVRQLLTQRGIEVQSGDAVVEVQAGELLLHSGRRVPCDECLWCTEATPAQWLRRTGLPTDSGGFLSINDKLQSEGGPSEVFAAGDVATCTAHPRPKAGVYAVRQGPPLAHNLHALLEGKPLRPFVPQTTALALISLGDRFCVASRTGTIPSISRHRRHRNRPHPASECRTTEYGKTDVAASASARGGDDGNGDVGGAKPVGSGLVAACRTDGKDGTVDDEDEEIQGGNEEEWLLGWLLNGCGGIFVGLTGPLLWRWKDAIDRAFMRKCNLAV